jgi:hypothetical protein
VSVTRLQNSAPILPLSSFDSVIIIHFCRPSNNSQATLLDSGFSDLSVPFDTSIDNPVNPANTPDFSNFYRSNNYDM